jgi:DNA-binding NtrC family response regulator
VLVAQNGAEALEVYQERGEEIALVVLDMVTPGMDGRECLRRLLEMDPGARVLIATGYTVSSSVLALVREGALGVVEKPSDSYAFSIAVREALDADCAPKVAGDEQARDVHRARSGSHRVRRGIR